MTGSKVRNLFVPGAWRRLWDGLGNLEAAMAVTEGEIHDQRISRLEAEVALLRAHIGVATDAAPGTMHASSGGIERPRWLS